MFSGNVRLIDILQELYDDYRNHYDHIVEDLIESILSKKLTKPKQSFGELLFPKNKEWDLEEILKTLNQHLIKGQSKLEASTTVSLQPFVNRIRMNIKLNSLITKLN